MAKQLIKQVKVQAPAGKATPAPPLGPVLGAAGINIGEFVNQFNDQTRERMGDIVPVVINVYDDRSFDFVTKVSPMSRLILKKIGKEKVEWLEGLITICSNCKQIKDEDGLWLRIESYIQANSNADFSHGICPDCRSKLYPDLKQKP